MASRNWAVLPPHGRRQRIGLFGGSFNPVHEGHVLVAETALRRLQLDWLWWLVTPGNPLKETGDLADIEARERAVMQVAAHPRMVVTDIEADLGTRYTADTLRVLMARAPQARFVWVMGADGLTHFHRWDRWSDIAARMPIAVVDRPGETFRAVASPAAHRMAKDRVDESDANLLANMAKPAWTFLHGPRNPISSTALRAL
ncbi:MAG: nicotinate-nucleotide adenylyltransferase, partial [Pseudomonadota bacterium]